MASVSNVSNARSLNVIICLTDGFATVENGIITTDNIKTSNIITDGINLNHNGRHLSVFDDLNNKSYYTEIICLSGKINSILEYENKNVINNGKSTLSFTM